MRLISFESLLCVFENSKDFQKMFDVDVRIHLDQLTYRNKHFSSITAFYFIFPLGRKIATYIHKKALENEQVLSRVEEVDLDMFAKEILKRYLEKTI